MKDIDALVSVGSSAISLAGPESLPGVSDELRTLLSRKNGFSAFGGALLVLPTVGTSAVPGLREWNDKDGWRRHYLGIPERALFFAMDLFAGQFGILPDGSVIRLEPESAQFSNHSTSLVEWSEVLIRNCDFETGRPLVQEWEVKYGGLEIGHRLLGRRPFVLGGEYEVENLVAIPCIEAMEYLGVLSTQVGEVPDGTKVTVKGWLHNR